MKNIDKQKIYKNIICSILILVLLFGGYFFPLGKAAVVTAAEATPTPIPDYINIITDNSIKEQLLGTSSQEARKNNPLGLASNFSVFAEQNVTFTGADVEGRVAAGGSVTATTDYEFQIGWKNSNNALADLIVGNGPVENIALTFGADNER